jgi:DNA-directed RNA polymerase I subunit RPA2
VLISGITGEEMTCEIFIGTVYYQRLRHMVSDKFQVRSIGPINQLTHQPIKGRKLGGGIRFGEMERDSLLAHGAAYLLHDRLHSCSDRHIGHVCRTCGSLLAPALEPSLAGAGAAESKVKCRACDSSKGVEKVAMPYVFKYLVSELAAMNIRVNLELSP